MTAAYADFISAKSRRFIGAGLPYTFKSGALYGFQGDLVERALRKGRYCIFADCGLGKTLMELEWAANVPGRVLLLTPLGVAKQIEAEAQRFGYSALVAREGKPADAHVTIANYERLHRFDPDDFQAVVLDESSILKAYDGKTRTQIIRAFAGHRYKLAATATPSPNDFMELGNHAEFVGAMTRTEMLAMFFVHDGGSTQDWRLKGHARREFWRWVGSWASMLRAPSDLGYPDEGFDLPPLRIEHHVVASEWTDGTLIPGANAPDLHGRRAARRSSLAARCDAAAALDHPDEPFLVWCDLNDESTAMAARIADAVEVTGSDTPEHKESALLGFGAGSVRALVSKSSIAGWGMNWQRCSRMVFVGLSDSYEAFYQASRRCWRFGQKRPVDVHLVYSEPERAVVENVLAKSARHREMQDALVAEVSAA